VNEQTAVTSADSIGEINIGQLARERFGHLGVFNIGCLGHDGSVTAAHEWDTPGIKMMVNPSRSESVEHLLHQAFRDKNVLLLFNRFDRDAGAKLVKRSVNEAVNRLLGKAKLERFIGVVYKVGICLSTMRRTYSVNSA
jgi:erythromycin esterase-like protein